jgi:hypothetical protein
VYTIAVNFYLKKYICKKINIIIICQEYDPNVKRTAKHLYKHLTNYSINKNNSEFLDAGTKGGRGAAGGGGGGGGRDDVGDATAEGEEVEGDEGDERVAGDGKGGRGGGEEEEEEDSHMLKWSLSALTQHLEASGVATAAVFAKIEDLVIRTLLTVEGSINAKMHEFVPHRRNCYELFGFDVMLDRFLHPWLIEVKSFLLCCKLNRWTARLRWQLTRRWIRKQ